MISVGTIQPRKNFEFLIDAFRYMPEETRKNLTLVIVGKRGANSKDICAKFKQQEDGSFVWLDYVLQEELQILVAGAKAMAFRLSPRDSGMPVIEAFAVGTPVISSNSTSLPEVAGNAAMLVSPYDIRNFSNGLSVLLSNDATREN